jgi:predicted SprT family Zn-dependent metalloprotease
MKDINYVRAMAQNCIEELNAIGLYPQITANDFFINTSIQKTLGVCWRNKKGYTNNKYMIEISTRMLGDDVLEEGLRLTILHELCHASDITFKDGHTGKWKEWAELVNDCYAVNIKRCILTAKYNIPPRKQPPKKKYVCECKHCGGKVCRMGYRAPKWYSLTEKHIAHGYYHKCADGTHGQLINPHIEK